jgi:hypothetical protein
MRKLLEITLIILLPIVWGLGVEYLFEWRRRRKLARLKRTEEAAR